MDRRHVEVDQRQFLLEVGLQEEAVYPHTGVVDDEINILTAGLRAGLREQARAFLPLREVRGDHDDAPVRILGKDLPAQLLQTVFPPRRQDQIVAPDGKIFGDLHSYSGARAGHQCIHRYPRFLSFTLMHNKP